VAATSLDNVLAPKALAAHVQVRFFSMNSGLPVTTPEEKAAFYQEIVEQRAREEYLTTDHMITVVTYHDKHYMYVSLDNSVRANSCGYPLKDKRLAAICRVINQVIAYLDGNTVLFCSEACRPSFDGGMAEKKDPVSWLHMRRDMAQMTGLCYVTECANNQDPGNMAFGIAAFCTKNLIEHVRGYYGVSVLDVGFGSVMVGVEMPGADDGPNEIIWAIHFPLDFRGKGEENQGYQTMRNCQAVMTKYQGSVLAFGDFNTIPGHIEDAIVSAIQPEFQFLVDDYGPTYFGSHYDLVPLNGADCPPSLV